MKHGCAVRRALQGVSAGHKDVQLVQISNLSHHVKTSQACNAKSTISGTSISLSLSLPPPNSYLGFHLILVMVTVDCKRNSGVSWFAP